ncbi:hypothetical protein N0V82_003171 [Gnomoniopsis sp. IMI 355080]|nr:hypothetical protein N0V82_003171 [Gnomoniopsis sp. IMI 355080]
MALRPPCRSHSRTFLSLPDELLLDIFQKVKEYRPTNKALHAGFASSSSQIAAIRLTCRRFAATSSHLLVHYICLNGLNLHSLEKLEEISRHPLIRKGVSIIRLELQCYVPNLAEDMGEFARWAVERVLDLARRHRRSFEQEVEISTHEDCDITESLLKRRDELAVWLRKLKVMLDVWSSTSVQKWDKRPTDPSNGTGKSDQQQKASDVSSCVESEPCIRLLREAHGLYRRRYEDQEALRKDNNFATRFATAMSRMPRAKWLEFQDFRHESNVSFDCCSGNDVSQACRGTRETDECAQLLNIDSLLEPMSWEEIKDHHYHSPPAEILFTLPVAIQKAGCTLDSILVRTMTQAEHYFPLLRNSMYNNSAVLRDAVQAIELKSFAFIHGVDAKTRTRETPTLEDLEAFKRYIVAMTSSDTLERFRLAVDSDWVSSSFEVEDALVFGDLISSTRWRNLRDIHMTGLSIRLEDLENVHYKLKSNETSLDFLTFSRVRLISGHWTEALEMLREMNIADKEVLEPTGAECDSLIMPLCSGYERIFGEKSGRGNEAGQFINGHIKHNPLR